MWICTRTTPPFLVGRVARAGRALWSSPQGGARPPPRHPPSSRCLDPAAARCSVSHSLTSNCGVPQVRTAKEVHVTSESPSTDHVCAPAGLPVVRPRDARRRLGSGRRRRGSSRAGRQGGGHLPPGPGRRRAARGRDRHHEGRPGAVRARLRPRLRRRPDRRGDAVPYRVVEQVLHRARGDAARGGRAARAGRSRCRAPECVRAR